MNAPVIIDVDTHLTEPPDLWLSRASSKWRDRVPQVKEVNGERRWVLDGDQVMGSMRASSVVLPDKSKSKGIKSIDLTIDQVHPASYDINERLALMDEMGVYAQILYPNLIGFGGAKLDSTDPELKTVCVQIYNDAMAEYQGISNERLFGMAILPWWDIDAAVKELERAKAMGLRGANMNPNPQKQGFPDLGEAHWHPLFEACEDLDLPMNFHIGASEDQRSWIGEVVWKSQFDDLKLAMAGATIMFENSGIITNLIMSGIAERYPRLQFVSVESGAGWIPSLLEALDFNTLDIYTIASEKLSMRPSEYFKRQFTACFWYERRHITDTIRQVGEDNLMFETDFPHPTCLYPNAVEYVSEALAELAPSVRHKLLAGNAARLYRIPLPNA